MDPNINQETGEAVSSGRSPRFVQWAAFLVFSTVTLGSSIQVKNNSEPVTSANKYMVACSAVTFFFTIIIVGAHFNPVSASVFVGTKVEGVVVLVLLAFWTAIVAVNTAAGDGLAPTEEGSDAVQNANLYYFSWAGFITAVVLLVSFLRDAFGVDVAGQIQRRAERLQYWAALLAASLIVMGSSASVHRADCLATSESNQSDSYCRKVKLGIAAGTLSVAFCCLVVSTKVFNYTATTATTPLMLEMIISVYLAIQNAFGVAYITSADAPGSAPGNLYYFSWAMFLISAVLGFECYGANGGDTEGAENGGVNSNGNKQYGGDIEVETFDDAI